MAAMGYQLNFNQDFTSVSVLGCGVNGGFRIFSINACDKVEEIYARDVEEIGLVERLFNSSLVVMVPVQKPNCLQMLHFKKKQVICNCIYPTDVLSVRMNRTRLIVCLAESIHIHDIRDMKILHSIENIAPNELGLCTLSLNSLMAYPVSSTSGELRIYNASKLREGQLIQAHNSKLSALNLSSNGQLLATASERGTVIRVFCVRNGQRLQEFRRGVKRCVNIASLAFSVEGDYLCLSSNTETVHIFKTDLEALEKMEHLYNLEQLKALSAKALEEAKKDRDSAKQVAEHAQRHAELEAAAASATATGTGGSGGWSDYLSKAVSSYLIPAQVTDVLAQDRAFATAVLMQPGTRHVCAVARVHKDLKLLIASDDGFLYIHEFNVERGGPCKLETVHDLRSVLDDVIELSLSENLDKMSPGTPTNSTVSQTTSYAVPTITIGSAKSKNNNSNNGNAANGGETTPTTSTNAKQSYSKRSAALFYIQNPDPTPDTSYAGILKGNQTANALTDSAKFRNLCDAIDTPAKLYDERQFPPVAIAARD